MGRSFANLHIKSENLEKTVEALRAISAEHPEVLGNPSIAVMYISQSNENWISVLNEFLVWGTVKKVGKTLSQLIEEPVMTAGYINEEIFELSIFKNGTIQAERIFCAEWTRDEYGLKEERLQDDYLRETVDIITEDFDDFIGITSPWQAVDKLSELVKITIWSDSEWIPHDENLRNQFVTYEFDLKNT
ncbi:hypothetical protein J31TS6_15640 [Brevibacillus reuszeri]|uniref:hypothetical protein n=1 Tax=Brevibacillus reuszeri TaxID=54915 RepID=UPI001B1BBCF4|nr:hypothetical protein [Brevibacillus reuszeri]GIO05536.1 hypothetical protein J31TS6_15640 [Brevibacillus reuszeri]